MNALSASLPGERAGMGRLEPQYASVGNTPTEWTEPMRVEWSRGSNGEQSNDTWYAERTPEMRDVPEVPAPIEPLPEPVAEPPPRHPAAYAHEPTERPRPTIEIPPVPPVRPAAISTPATERPHADAQNDTPRTAKLPDERPRLAPHDMPPPGYDYARMGVATPNSEAPRAMPTPVREVPQRVLSPTSEVPRSISMPPREAFGQSMPTPAREAPQRVFSPTSEVPRSIPMPPREAFGQSMPTPAREIPQRVLSPTSEAPRSIPMPPREVFGQSMPTPAREVPQRVFSPTSEVPRSIPMPPHDGLGQSLATPVREMPHGLPTPTRDVPQRALSPAADTPREAARPSPDVPRAVLPEMVPVQPTPVPATAAQAAPPTPSAGLYTDQANAQSSRTIDTTDTPTQYMSSDDDDETDGETALTTAPDASDEAKSPSDEMLDISHMNRLPPSLDPPRSVPFKSQIGPSDLFRGTLVAAVHDKVRVAVLGEGPSGFADKLLPQAAEHYVALGSPTNLSPNSRELRITALSFCPPIGIAPAPDEPLEPMSEGRFVWYGTHNGNLGELDILTGQLTALRTTTHKDRILLLRRVGAAMLVLDESGKISAWVPRHGKVLSLAHTNPHSQRITLPKHAYTAVLGDQLWVCSVALVPRANPMQPAQKVQQVRMYNPLADDRPFNALSRPMTLPLTKESGMGGVTSAAYVPQCPNQVFLGHESGHISVWSTKDFACTDVHRVGDQPLVAMTGLHSMLWTATRSGQITLYKVDSPLWRAAKSWQAHREAVTALLFDPYGLDPLRGELFVCSIGNDHFAYFWDGFLSDDWLDQELGKCAPSFSSSRSVRVLEMTYNIGAAAPSDLFGVVDNMELFQRVLRNSCSFSAPGEPASEYCDEYNSPDVIVIGFQELIDLEDKRLTAKRLLLGNKRREGKEFDTNISSQHKAWHDQLVNFVRLALPPEAPYAVLLSESMVGLFSMVFVKASIMSRTRNATTYKVKTGLGGHYGNKGAIVTRFVVDDTSLCFINCHLAAGQRNVRQRNSDVTDIMQSISPTPTQKTRDVAYVGGGDGTMILDHEICFIAGDLNYRLDMRREVVLNIIQQQRYDELTAADQLLTELRHNVAFRLRGFQEAPIHFPPTYKLNRLTDDWDSSEKARIPAYCDRILWRGFNSDTVQCTSYKRWDATLSDHRPVSATFRVRVKSIDPVRRAQVLEQKTAELAQYKHSVLSEILRFHHGL